MSTRENKAVFLSYASQDAEAARKICDALRAAGIEVWFDQSELRGGDAWDAKIRKQIKECALFVPIISANTQARAEGYFRLEWKLAADRSHLIARDHPFLVPIVIDATANDVARVPEEFHAVQWTRLRNGESTPAFGARVVTLLGTEGAPTSSMGPGGSAAAKPVHRGSPGSRWRVPAALAGIAALSAFAFWQLWRKPVSETAPQRTDIRAEKPEINVPRLGAKSIVVLPFENQSADPEANAFFAEGMHEDLITNLLLVRDLRCVPRTTAMTYRGTKKTNREIADELGVAYVLTGTVRRAEKQVRITGTLINGRTDEAVWTKPYDKELAGSDAMFAMQSELAEAIAAELKATLSPEEKSLVQRRPTANTAAYDLYLKAREMRRLGHSDDTPSFGAFADKQEALLREALALDPLFAIAWADLAWIHSYKYFFNVDRTDARLALAKTAIDTAQRLAPGAPEVSLSLGFYYYFAASEFAWATDQFQKLITSQPNNPLPRYGLALVQRHQGKWPDALQGFHRVAQLDPANLDYLSQIMNTGASARRWDEAIAALETRIKLGERQTDAWTLAQLKFRASGSTLAMEEIARGLPSVDSRRRYLAALRGDYGEVARLDAVEPATGVSGALVVSTALAAQGDWAAARSRLQAFPAQMRERLQRVPSNEALWSDLGMVEAVLGNQAEAVRCAKKGVELAAQSPNARYTTSTEPQRIFDLAFVHAWTGDTDSSLAEYAHMLRTPIRLTATPRIPTNVHVMKRHPYFFPLQGDPRFEALLNDPKNNAPLF